MPYSVNGTAPPPFFHTSHDAVPMRAYRTDHAGPAVHRRIDLQSRFSTHMSLPTLFLCPCGNTLFGSYHEQS